MSRLEWILGVLLVVLLVVVLGISAFLWLRPKAPELPAGLPPTAVTQSLPIPTPPYEQKSALVAYAFAQRAVQDWYQDAMLLDATATWPQGVTAEILRQGEASWAFTFYSPGSSAVTLVTVLGDEANRISESAYRQDAAPLDVGGWRLDSQQAVDVFLSSGGTQFLQEVGASNLIMQLTTTGTEISWFLSLFSSSNGRSFDMRVHATTGDVLEVQSVP